MASTSPERYGRVKAILEAALELDPAEQAAYIEKVCAGDAELEAEALSLLEHDRKSAGFLNKPIMEPAQSGYRLKPGARLGPYEVVEPLGAGGMGEVYRAHDPRFGRDVAIKLLPEAFAHDEARLARFEREARAAGSLNHPNVLTVHDLDWQDGAPYLVAELLEGETLRERLHTAMDAATAVAYAAQIARGLAAAHAMGIVHRDLKPENVFVTRHGVVKILDFGLAKLPEVSSARSEPGMILGSMGYMSPEQIRGESAGPPSDVFSLGVILFEMLAGRRPFFAETWVQEANAILTGEPAELPRELTGISDHLALARTVRQCLAQRPEDRLKAGDGLAGALESRLARTDAMPKRKGIGWALRGAAAAALATSALFGLWLARTRPAVDRGPAVNRGPLTFLTGIVSAARFTADGRRTVYSAQWGSDDFRVYSVPTESPEAEPTELARAMLFAVSPRGVLALCLPPRELTQYAVVGVLARMPLSGGIPERVAENISAADWSPDGNLVVVRVRDDRSQIEYPLDEKVLYHGQPGGYIDAVRMSPGGDRIAWLDHPQPDDSAGEVKVIDVRSGDTQTISQRFNSMRGLAWSPDGEEVWFAAAETGLTMELWAARPPGQKARRLNFSVQQYFSVEDTSTGGRALLSYHGLTQSMVYGAPDGTQSLVPAADQSQVRDLAGGQVLYSESGQTTGADYESRLRKTGRSASRDLGIGRPLSLRLDRGALAITAGPPAAHLVLLPIPKGGPEPLNTADKIPIGAAWLPGGNSFIFAGIAPGGDLRYYAQTAGDAEPKAITGHVHYKPRSPIVVSQDGRFVAAVGSDKRVMISPAAGGAAREVPGLEGYTPLRWCSDDRLVLARYDDPLERARLWKADALTGDLAFWRELNPPDKVGLLDITPIRVSPDCGTYAYSPLTVHSVIHLVTNLR